jgi:hypothetical protein
MSTRCVSPTRRYVFGNNARSAVTTLMWRRPELRDWFPLPALLAEEGTWAA